MKVKDEEVTRIIPFECNIVWIVRKGVKSVPAFQGQISHAGLED